MFHGEEKGIIYKPETVYNRDLSKEIFSVPYIAAGCFSAGQKACTVLLSCLFPVGDGECVNRHVFDPPATVSQEYPICSL